MSYLKKAVILVDSWILGGERYLRVHSFKLCILTRIKLLFSRTNSTKIQIRLLINLESSYPSTLQICLIVGIFEAQPRYCGNQF
jgi:hypothetical protein